ncbi:MAG: DUF512 domain-containing protein, partial [Lachnospiraceae bacterium]|nr:DUF512 domain-containing protein [Lachnospiraceae bacterium]
SRFRDGLYPLEPFEKEDAVQVLNCIHKWQEELFPKYGLHFVHASDEWYILAEQELPEEERYDGYLQLENGVGMLRLLINEFEEAMEELPSESELPGKSEELSLVTGKLAYPYIRRMADRMMQRFDGLSIHVYDITNYFFGERITVSGLLTGQDIIGQLRGKKLGERILLPQNVLRSGEDYFLDDITVAEVEKALQVKVDIVKSSGREFVNVILRLNEE